METEIVEVAQIVEGGEKITVVRYTTPNYFIHRIGVTVAEALAGMIESDSANSRGQAVPEEVRNLRNGWAMTKMEIDNARLLRDMPAGAYEELYFLLVPHINEVMQIGNVKLKAVAIQYRFFINRLFGIDSSSLQGFIGDADLEKIGKLTKGIDTILDQYVGTGEGDPETGFKTGIVAPEWKTGRMVPPIDTGTATIREPGSGLPASPWPDAPDHDRVTTTVTATTEVKE